MSYVLISLPGDDAARDADEFAKWFAKRRRAPVIEFRDPAPDHEAIRIAVSATPLVLIFGHDGGGALRASSAGPQWADARTLGRICRGARIYAFACNTMGGHSRDDIQGLGVDAVKAGVRVFAGHPTSVPSATGLDPRSKYEHAVKQAIGAVLVEFLDGCSDDRVLRLRAEKSFNLVHERFGAMGGAPAAVNAAMAHLRIAKRE